MRLLSLALTAFLFACSDHSSAQHPNPGSNPPPPTVGPDCVIDDLGDHHGRRHKRHKRHEHYEKDCPMDRDCPAGGQPVPEPATLLLVGSGLAGVAIMNRRRKTAAEQIEEV